MLMMGRLVSGPWGSRDGERNKTNTIMANTNITCDYYPLRIEN